MEYQTASEWSTEDVAVRSIPVKFEPRRSARVLCIGREPNIHGLGGRSDGRLAVLYPPPHPHGPHLLSRSHPRLARPTELHTSSPPSPSILRIDCRVPCRSRASDSQRRAPGRKCLSHLKMLVIPIIVDPASAEERRDSELRPQGSRGGGVRSKAGDKLLMWHIGRTWRWHGNSVHVYPG
jgi:hypothetical protein